MTREDRLMPDDLAAIRERAERVRQSGSIVGGMIARDIVREDISKLLAEIERLRADRYLAYADGYEQGRFDERLEYEHKIGKYAEKEDDTE